MEKIIREGVWHLVAAVVGAAVGWGLSTFITVDNDWKVRVGLRERVEVWQLSAEVRRLERDNDRLEREVERLRRRN